MSSSTLVIIGCSDGLLKVMDQLPEILKKYDTFGINRAALYFKTTYGMWMDNRKYRNNIYKHDGNKFVPFLKFLPNEDLFGAATSVSFAIDFAAKNGYNKVILYGILDGEYKIVHKTGFHCGHWLVSYKHFYRPEKVHHKTLMQIQQFKHFIFAHKHKIQIEIPNKTM